jgi:hypothetical protein
MELAEHAMHVPDAFRFPDRFRTSQARGTMRQKG